MKVLSLFDGISCGRVALERAGIPVSRYVAYEIDKNAIKCSAHNWPDIEHRGSVIGADFSEFVGFDLVMGGFPCQDLSIAGKRAGLKGMRSGLFWYLVDAIETVKPRYFFVENNVGMPKEAKRVITETLGVEPIKINSALVSAQSRNRLYWTNISNVDIPNDRGVFLSSILKYYSPDYYYLSERNIAYIKRKTYGNIQYDILNPPQKSWCVCATLYKKKFSAVGYYARRALAGTIARRMRTTYGTARRLYRHDTSTQPVPMLRQRLAGRHDRTLF